MKAIVSPAYIVKRTTEGSPVKTYARIGLSESDVQIIWFRSFHLTKEFPINDAEVLVKQFKGYNLIKCEYAITLDTLFKTLINFELVK